MLSELKYPIHANDSKADIEFRMGGYLSSIVDNDRIRSISLSSQTYANCIHFALAQSVGLMENPLFLSGENKCTSINFEKDFDQVPIELSDEGDPVLYISSSSNLMVTHAGRLYKKSEKLVISQQGSSSSIIVHKMFAVPLDYGCVVVILKPKKSFSLACMARDSEIFCYNTLKNYETYKKDVALAQKNFLCFILKQWNASLRELDREQKKRVSVACQKSIASMQESKSPQCLDSILLQFRGCILDMHLKSGQYPDDSKIGDTVIQILQKMGMM